MYLSVLLGLAIEPCANMLEHMIPGGVVERLSPLLARSMISLGLGSMNYRPLRNDTWRAKVLWEEADQRDIRMQEFRFLNKSRDAFESDFNKDVRFFEALPRPKHYNTEGSRWMDYKAAMKKHFMNAGIPIARGGTAFTVKHALSIFESTPKPVIVKPNYGTRSRHTTIHISNEKEFVEAFKKARLLSPVVMIEEELSGFVFRGTMVNKKMAATLRREPAYVIGDGKHRIRELLEIENKNPLRKGPIFHTIHVDEDTVRELAHFGRTWNTIARKGEIVTLGQKTSRAVGGGITDVTDDMHPENIALLERVAHVVNDPIIGVDFIMQDVSKPWFDQPHSGVIECNSAPFIDLHHFPLVGKPRNVAGAVWDLIYPASSRRQS